MLIDLYRCTCFEGQGNSRNIIKRDIVKAVEDKASTLGSEFRIPALKKMKKRAMTSASTFVSQRFGGYKTRSLDRQKALGGDMA